MRRNKITTFNSMWVIPAVVYFVPASFAAQNPCAAIRMQEKLYGKDAYDSYTASGLRQADSMLRFTALATPCILAKYFGYAFPTFEEFINEVCKLASPKTAPLFSIAVVVSISSLVLVGTINKLNESENKGADKKTVSLVGSAFYTSKLK